MTLSKTRTSRTASALAVTLLLAVGAGSAHGDQFRRLGNWDVHYILIPTLFLNSEVATGYQIDRSRDRALLNISVLSRDGVPAVAQVSGRVINLLEQSQQLEFKEVTEGTAVYYLAEVRHADQEVLRFVVDIVPPDGVAQQLKFQQKVYWEAQ
jgi:hypothetical protein